jgi:glycine cleavage system transcriptional repressor
VPNPADPVGLVAVTVLGDDRPGIVADVSSVLAELGCNLEDSTMTLLRGHFVMVVLVRTERPLGDVEAALRPLTDGGDLVVDVRSLPEHGDTVVPGTAYTMHVHGADRPGIVAAMTNVVARHDGNIVDLGTRLGDAVYVLIAEFVLPPGASIDDVEEELARVAQEIGVDFHVSVVEDDLL